MRPLIRSAARLGALASTAFAVFSASACASDRTAGPRTVEQQLADLRANTTPYLATPAATAAGWSSVVTDCMSDPVLGGMGVHYADVARFDTTLDPQRPEILVYEPQNGALRLAAVEYAVPLAAWTRPEPPSVLGQRFHVNTQFGLWVLHAWIQKSNPAGVFADWNPSVSCPAAPAR